MVKELKNADWRTIGIWLANILLAVVGYLGVALKINQDAIELKQNDFRIQYAKDMTKVMSKLEDPRFTQKDFDAEMKPRDIMNEKQNSTLIDHEQRIRVLEKE